MDIDKLVADTTQWFKDRNLTDAIVGFSGGIDSTVTALLLQRAGIDTTLMVASAPNQRTASPIGGLIGLNFADERGFKSAFCGITYPGYPSLTPEVEGSAEQFSAYCEAALPILRVAAFYAEAARLRVLGKRPVVVGTVNFSEAAFLGFWGKASDAALDFYPISHLTKAQVYELARALDAPQEAIDAVPSGDLLFTETNDREMIGATYEQIEKIISAAERDLQMDEALIASMMMVDDPRKLNENITRNAFKYDLPFPGFHLSNRLETFRQKYYPAIRRIAEWRMRP